MTTKTSVKALIVFFILFISACSTSDDKEGRRIAIQSAVDNVRSRLSATINKPIPSLSIYIQTPEGTWFVSSADTVAQRLTERTHFRFASNTKTFTATAILKMHQNGWLDIHSLITATIPGASIPYVPDTPEWNIHNKSSITIEQLLQHAASVYDVDNQVRDDYWHGMSYVGWQMSLDPSHQFSADELVGQLAIHPDLYYDSPNYSNTGYTILSEIIARVYSARAGSAKTYSDYLYDHVIGGSSPVQLNVIKFPHLASDNTLPAPNVSGIEYDSSNPIVYTSWNMSAHVGEGNGYGNFVDLNRFVRTLFSGKNVLNPTTVNMMITDINPLTNGNYALGCDHVKNLGYGHNGAICGYLSTIRYNPDTDVSIVVLMPMIDGTDGIISLNTCIMEGIYSAAWETLSILGYPGRP
ncbi:MAG: serine hydrolase domain-containing protein [Clostridia bacterium]